MSSIERLAKRILDPAPYHSGPVWVNRAGWQVARILPRHLLHAARRRPRMLGALADQTDAMEKLGILIIPNFLPAAEFARVRAYCERLRDSPTMRREPDREHSGVDWMHGPIGRTDPEGRWVHERIARNPLLFGAVAAITRRRPTRPPQMGYQLLSMRADRSYATDAEAVLHADRHFPTAKAYFSLNGSTQENGAYVWAPGTHRMTIARLRHEYEYSIRQAIFVRRGAQGLPAGSVEAGMVKIDPEFWQAMGVREEPILTEPNTMVISNNFGFHRRGHFSPGSVREQIRLVFHYLEEPFYATWLWKGLSALDSRQMLPARVRRAVLYRLG